VSPVAQYLVQSAVTLLGVLLLVGVIVLGTRRLGLKATDRNLELVGRLPLEARRAVYLVRVKERIFVLAANDHAITKLGEVAADDLSSTGLASTELASIGPGAGAFADALRRVLGTGKPLAKPVTKPSQPAAPPSSPGQPSSPASASPTTRETPPERS
jgi:flagellar biogenesis protein FliO